MISKQTIIEEYIKCATNPEYAIETYLKTFDKTQEGFVPFKLFPKQKQIIESYDKHRNNLITKPRQAGISTTTQAYAAIKCAFADKNNPECIVVIANKLTLAKKFLKGIKDFINQLPRWIWGADYYGDDKSEKVDIFIVNSQIHIQLPNGSQIIAVATSVDALRGFTPTFLIFDEAAFIDNGAELYAAAITSMSTGGKAILISCVTDDTFIQTNNGLRQVSDFIDYDKPDNPNEGYFINEYNVLGKNKTRKSNIIVNNGYQKTVKLETANAFLEGTKTHKLWVFDNKNKRFRWKTMGEITPEDYVNIQYGYNIFGNDDKINLDYQFSNKEHKPNKIYDKIDTNLAYLIGLYLSEGYTYKKYNDNGEHIGTNITITCDDYIGNFIENAGFKYSSHDKLHYTISSKYLGALLENIGINLNLKAKDKFIPNKLLSMSKTNTIAMVRGFMDGDGYSDIKRGRVGLNISSKKMCLQFRQLFLNIGILTDYQEGITPKNKLVNVESDYYRLSATSIDAEKYYSIIGFSFERKMIKKSGLKKVNPNNRYRVIPNGKNIIKDIVKEHQLTYKFRGSGLKLSSLRVKGGSGNLSVNIFKDFINYIENILLVDLKKYSIDKILMDNSKWVPIKSITYKEAKTYDFSLPHNGDDFWCHSIIYNGILGHQTPNGMDPLYYKTYEQAQVKGEDGKPSNGYNVIEMKWYQDPRYNKDLEWIKDDKDTGKEERIEDGIRNHEHFNKMLKLGYKPTSTWYRDMCKSMNFDSRRIAQELDVSFLGSGGNVINDEFILMHETENVEEPKFVDDKYSDGNSGQIWIWEKPIEGHEYICSIDVARGDGADYSTMIIIDFTTMEQVVEYQGKIPPDRLAEIGYEYGMLYNAYVIVDNIGIGLTTVLKLVEMGYPNLHYDKLRPSAYNTKIDINMYKKNDKVPGFNVNGVRTQLISNLEMNIRLNLIKIRSKRLCMEMKTLIYKNGKADHMEGYHDDLLFSLGMALYIMEFSFKNLKKLKNSSEAILSGWVSGQNTTLEDNSYKPKSETNRKPITPTMVTNNNNNNPYGNHMWLFSGYR